MSDASELYIQELNKLKAENATLERRLADEEERHAQLQSRCFDQGGNSVFDEVKQLRQEVIDSVTSSEPVEIEAPDYHPQAMGCGLEDRNITDRYEAMRYGWDEAVFRCFEGIPFPLYLASPQVTAWPWISVKDKLPLPPIGVVFVLQELEYIGQGMPKPPAQVICMGTYDDEYGPVWEDEYGNGLDGIREGGVRGDKVTHFMEQDALYPLPAMTAASPKVIHPPVNTDKLDAERYRKFRQSFTTAQKRDFIARILGVEEGHFEPNLDAAIDASITKDTKAD